MIELHRLNGELFYLNSDLIETVESNPDTVVRLVNGHRYVVTEAREDVIGAVRDFRKAVSYTCVPVNMTPDSDEN